MRRKTRIAVAAVLLAVCAAGVTRAEWEPAVRLTEDEGNSWLTDNNARAVAAAGSQLFVVWYDDRDGNSEIYYKVKGTLGWGPDTRLTTGDSVSRVPAVATSAVGGGSHVHVAWEDYLNGDLEIFYQRSTNGGMTWTGTRITPDDTFASWGPSIAASSLDVHVVWEDKRDGQSEVYYARSSDGGLNWSAARLTGEDTCGSGSPSVAVSGNCVHVAWEDTREADDGIYHKRSTDRGITWGAETRLSDRPSRADYCSIACSDAKVHVAWRELAGAYKICYRRSLDSGVTWGDVTGLTDDSASAGSTDPSVAAFGSYVHVAWRELHPGGIRNIYYRRSTDSGAGWEPGQLLTDNPEGSHRPSVAISGSMVHVVWTDERDGNPEIYYMRNTTGSAVEQGPNVRFLRSVLPTVVRGCLCLPADTESRMAKGELLDPTGRRVMDLQPGANDVRHLSPGVYFALQPSVDGRQPTAVRKIIVQQ